MPYKRIRPTIMTDDSAPFTSYEETLDEPASGEAHGMVLDLVYTPVAGETIETGVVAGPVGRSRVDVSSDGGSTWHPVGGQAISGPFKLRIAAVPFAGDDSENTTHAIAMAGEGEAADWAG